MSGAAEFTLTQHEKAVTKLSAAATRARRRRPRPPYYARRGPHAHCSCHGAPDRRGRRPPAAKLIIERRRQRASASRRSTPSTAAVADAAGNRAASVAAVVEQIKGSSAKDVAAAKALLQTLESEVLLGRRRGSRKWGQHYCRTFP